MAMRRKASAMREIAVIIVNYRTADLAIRCLRALEPARASFAGLHAVVVDGGSDDGSADRIAAATATLDWVTVLPLGVNGGFAFANNRALALLAERGPLPDAVALINPDARVRPGALEAMAALLDREPRAGAVGARLVREDGRPQSSAFRFPSVRGEFCRGARTHLFERLLGVPPTSIQVDRAAEVPWVTGAAVMLRTQALLGTKLFDEGFFLYYEETDLMRRLRRGGWSIWHEPVAEVVHDGGAATKIRDPESGMPLARRMPRYWYESRRRYFALARGRGYAALVGAAWLIGHGWWVLRQTIAPRRDEGALSEAGDLIRYGLWPAPLDGKPAAPGFDDPPSDLPAWMAHK